MSETPKDWADEEAERIAGFGWNNNDRRKVAAALRAARDAALEEAAKLAERSKRLADAGGLDVAVVKFDTPDEIAAAIRAIKEKPSA